MKRLIPIFAAIVALAGPLALGDVAVAKDQHGGDRGGRDGGRGADRGGGDRGGRGADQGGRGGEYRGDRGGYERRGADDRGVYRDRAAPPPGWREDRGGPDRGDRRVYESEAPPPYYAPRARRGGYMPPQAGSAVPDYGRYRLRPPPRGFVWVRTGNGYAMVSQDTGRVFDVVPY
jgi:Ni/Co efflux regulator RcnB